MNIDKELQKWLKRLVILIFCLILFFFLQYIGVVRGIISIIIALTPLYIGVFISWLMKPVATFLHDKCKLNYGLSSFLSILLLLLIVSLLIFTIIPEIFFQLKSFISSLSSSLTILLNQLEDMGLFNPKSRLFMEIDSYLATYNLSINTLLEQGINWIKDHSNIITSGISSTINILQSTIGVISQIGIGFLFSFYLMPNFDHYIHVFIKKITTEKQKNITDDLHNISTKLRQYLKGLLLDGLSIFSILVVLNLILFGSKIGFLTCLVFCFIAAIFNSIPYIGPFIGAVPLVLVVFEHFGIGGMLMAILIICIAQFVESNIIYPKIMGTTINMHPVTLMTGLLIFSTLFGIAGMFLATPILTVIKIFLVKFGIIEEDDL